MNTGSKADDAIGKAVVNVMKANVVAPLIKKKEKRVYCIVDSCRQKLEPGRIECCKAGNHGWPTNQGPDPVLTVVDEAGDVS